MTGFEGVGDFDSPDPWQRYTAHQAAKGRSHATPQQKEPAMSTTERNEVAYIVSDLQAVEPDQLAQVEGIQIRVAPEKDSMGFDRVDVIGPTIDATVEYVRSQWGDEDPDWFRDRVIMNCEPLAEIPPRLMRDKILTGRMNAARALEAYRASGGQDPSDAAAIGDLIADLLHLANVDENTDVFAVGRMALHHWEYESDPENQDEEV